jgi:hypothetical protein
MNLAIAGASHQADMEQSPQPTPWVESTADDQYQYTIIDTAQKQIRLFCITQDEDGRMQGHLKNFNISDDGTDCREYEYKALSYIWGPTHPTKHITVDGSQITVRQNLYELLAVYARDNLTE